MNAESLKESINQVAVLVYRYLESKLGAWPALSFGQRNDEVEVGRLRS